MKAATALSLPESPKLPLARFTDSAAAPPSRHLLPNPNTDSPNSSAQLSSPLQLPP